MTINSVMNTGLSGMQTSLNQLEKNAMDIASAGVKEAQAMQGEQGANQEVKAEAQSFSRDDGAAANLTEALVEQRALETQFQASAKVVETGKNLIDTMLENT